MSNSTQPAAANSPVEVLTKAIQRQGSQIQALAKDLTDMRGRLEKTPMPGTEAFRQMLASGQAPRARQGEDIMSSRGYKFMNLIGVIAGQCDPSQAKVELEMHERLHKAVAGNGNYDYKGAGMAGLPLGKALAPLSTSFIHDQYVDRQFRRDTKALVSAGVSDVDPDEVDWTARRLQPGMTGRKTLSWLSEGTGGALVAPPEFGELITLLRNNEALVNAGARVVPLPPQGRIQYPRQTSASLTYWVGENRPITDSDIGTGTLTLQAKKLAVMIKAPNELLRFASPAAEALMRDDMTKSLALGLDLACLEGLGGDHRPRGILQTEGIQQITSSSPGATADALVAQDVYRMIAAVEEANAQFEGFIMRPKTLYKFYQLRADAVAQADKQGVFLFNMMRDPGSPMGDILAGYPVIKSTQVSQSRQKVSNGPSNLTYILGGMFSDVLIGMFGAIEFASTVQGDTAFTYDQTWVRGILSADVGVRRPISLVYMDNLDVVNL